ncbi:HlyD family secretion protein [Brumimicrobium oceani]|uniref:Biotin attachment protein n=1 Tax=Brumimicrobium oceani TaxID=2100725 RepID=A0A2U2X0Q9_9FLAO|nr:HlyD family efflux transporter periplasmic adaptor subunit [Brumimicrobium oceani]PWH81363.1 biotin attachment protein [Brumimicrobium oceani]
MLNLSKNPIHKKINSSKYSALTIVKNRVGHRVLPRILTGALIIFIIFLFVPWTQNIRARGTVTALSPESRPQMLHSIIPGRIEEWFVREGDFVKRGDTIVKISEIKSEYFDPQLVERTTDQVEASEKSIEAYSSKVNTLEDQIKNLQAVLSLKLEQAKNKLKQAQLKVKSDSIKYVATTLNEEIAKKQLDRFEELFNDGLKSQTEFESRKLKYQKTIAEQIGAENDLLASRNEVINAQIELTTIRNDYNISISKINSEKFSTASNQMSAIKDLRSLENKLSNYQVRQGLYYVTSPQDGYITESLTTGIGEMIKENQQIVSIMPANADLAVEMFVQPINIPLLKKGQHVRIQFDGWPAIVFSGWPNKSYGTFGGTVNAIDRFAQADGTFRILVEPDTTKQSWPEVLSLGGGANSMLLLSDVPIWYELWRQFNGFPPDYYSNGTSNSKEKEK